MSICVIDASLAASWCLPDEDQSTDRWLERVLVEGAVVPALWPFEIGNILLMAQRRNRINEAQALRARVLLGKVPITIEAAPTLVASGEILQLARTHQLTFYDACYLELAMRLHLPIGTLDEPLLKAAVAVGVSADL